MPTPACKRIVTALAASCALVLTTPAGAEATSIGTAPVHTFEYSVGGVTVKVPTGCMFTHVIRGSGRRITYQNAGVDCAFVAALSSGFCNWRIDFTYADTDNRVYRRVTRPDAQRVQDRRDARQLSSDVASLWQSVRPPLCQRSAAREPVSPHHHVSWA
ncbi:MULTISPECIES: hypothetical protein [unclassified Streptomyces]|uniref:hypothetical protein n=1 Tax=unclassified Streptomyces TaxID=2593676 RepID=UPI0040423F1C